MIRQLAVITVSESTTNIFKEKKKFHRHSKEFIPLQKIPNGFQGQILRTISMIFTPLKMLP